MDVSEIKLKERLPKTIITLPTLGKLKKESSTIPNMLRVNRASR